MAEEHVSYGGQAVIEGVMIRGRKGYATAFRLADGSIETAQHPWEPLTRRHRLLSLPIVRGTPALIDAMLIGYRSLIASADVAAKGEGIKPPSTIHYVFSIAFALAIAIGGFVLAPSWVAGFKLWHFSATHDSFTGSIYKNLLEGLVKLCAFVAFIFATSFMPDMRRVFQYHGAEHKVINAFEATGRYDDDAVNNYRTLHQRCGTSFIFTVIFVSILVHAVMGWPSMAVRLLSRLLVLPVVAGLAYEIIKLAGSHKTSAFMNVMVAPGMWMQRITTREPTPDQIEVARRSLQAALELDGVKTEAGAA